MKKKIVFLLKAAVLLLFGLCIGFLGHIAVERQNERTVAIRVGNVRAETDYDLWAAINYLSYQLERSGYKVLGTAYGGELYPEEFNRAGINVFVRGFLPFFDVRRNEAGKNLFYIHRADAFFKEELRRYDTYLFSIDKFYNKMKQDVAAVFFWGGGVPHERLEPQYEYDVLYIYEDDQGDFSGFLKNSLDAKTYGAVSFALLSSKEREDLFKRARVVLYNMMPEDEDADFDENYVPYAVYDIMSYGRPLVTNRRLGLVNDFIGKVWLYGDGFESRVSALQDALGLTDDVRENIAGAARKKLLNMEEEKAVLPIF